jgi:hypothetical protein
MYTENAQTYEVVKTHYRHSAENVRHLENYATFFLAYTFVKEELSLYTPGGIIGGVEL